MCICVHVYIYIYRLIKKAWDFIWLPYLNPTILGVIGLMFLNQVPTLSIHQSIDLASNYKYIYIHVCVYIYIYIDTHVYLCAHML